MAGTDAETYGKYADELLRFAATLVGPSMAEDVMAHAVMRAFSSPGWPSVENHRAYLYRTVLNEARQLGRAAKRRMLREERAAAHESIDGSHVRAEVLDAMRRLSIRQRAVVFLTYWADLSVDDVSSTLQVSPSTVQRELRAARTNLQELLR
jgi:RNA polymerase sigma-70 factor (ECF subfamily)